MLCLLVFLLCIAAGNFLAVKPVVESENAVADLPVLDKIAAEHLSHHYHYWNFSTIGANKKSRKQRRDLWKIGKKTLGFAAKPIAESAFQYWGEKFADKTLNVLAEIAFNKEQNNAVASPEIPDMGGLVKTFSQGLIGAASEVVSVANTTFQGLKLLKEVGVRQLAGEHESPGGGCKWFGNAPLCDGECPADFDYVRSHNGQGLPDKTFGKECWQNYKKRYCCRQNSNDCTWAGHWINAQTARVYYCNYQANETCGSIICRTTSSPVQRSQITGEHCDTIQMFGRQGLATCGFIAFFGDNDHVEESWYKTILSFDV